MTDSVVVTAPDSSTGVLAPSISDAIIAAAYYANLAAIDEAGAAAAAALAVVAAVSEAFAGQFRVSALPLTGALTAFATNGRGIGDPPGAGSGVPVYYAAGAWRTYYSCAPVQA